MDIFLLLFVAAGCLAGLGVGAFMWAVRTHQFEDPDMQAQRILHEDDERD
ncbi:cbb3-type cytochrome oxidase assembly protein CcoS [Asticcacaulis sp. BYS171W]|uniref:Cbb3-type cytochrome oxidase assembly protein CcoS n=1 Tax=Asticcacaulis aquaticus TaxID=2984212 RepID=A0ABT5HWQ5_9CAUL|nr:cbb3-type cytochrome oxidase assembly protein CcoS [Asticcacaulis aquaticus]MDC7684469.1 cbb3-type cytochrome oxidase assembly protein CcoS [Asticcacaulis aquaticus]